MDDSSADVVPDRVVPDRAVPDHVVPDRAVPDRAVPDRAGRPWRLLMSNVGEANAPGLLGAYKALDVRTPVIVKTQYLDSWTRGFEVAEQVVDGYRLRRRSDGAVLPHVVAFDDVRPDVPAFEAVPARTRWPAVTNATYR